MVDIALSRGLSTEVDSEDFDLADSNWYAAKGHREGLYYARRGVWVNGKLGKLWMHRVIMERILGRALGKDELVDHKDRNSLNNHRSNLRIASTSQNQANRIGWGLNRSGYKGVYATNGKFRALITVKKKRIHLGYFSEAIQAYEAYVKASALYFGEFANTGEAFP